MRIEPSGQACGARVTGVDLSGDLPDALVADIREAWLAHHVLAFPGQRMDDDALERLPDALRAKVEGHRAIHSAQKAYAPDGFYGDADAPDRAMIIRPSDEARQTQLHDFIRAHPETGRPGLFGCLGYVIGFEGMEEVEALPLLVELYRHQSDEAFHYRHRWEPDMLLMWDNRSLLHAAAGGYAGHHRLLHRTTIAAA